MAHTVYYAVCIIWAHLCPQIIAEIIATDQTETTISVVVMQLSFIAWDSQGGSQAEQASGLSKRVMQSSLQ